MTPLERRQITHPEEFKEYVWYCGKLNKFMVLDNYDHHLFSVRPLTWKVKSRPIKATWVTIYEWEYWGEL
jgi:hypothetical protein